MADDSLSNLLNSPNIDWETWQFANSLRKQKQNLEQMIGPVDIEPRENAFMWGLNTLAKGQQAVAGVIDSAFIRKDIFDPGVGLGVKRAWKERTTGADLLRRTGVKSPVTRGLAGFALDVGLDPLSWLGGVGLASKLPRFANKFASPFGKETAGRITAHATAQGLDFLESSKRVERFFEDASELNTLRRTASKLDSPAAKLELARRIESKEATVGSVLASIGGSLSDTEALFRKPTIDIGLNIPFLGHIIPESNAALKHVKVGNQSSLQNFISDLTAPLKATRLTGKAAEVAGRGAGGTLRALSAVADKVINPKAVGVSLEIPEALAGAFENIASHAKAGIGATISGLNSVRRSVEELPVLGGPTKIASTLAEKTGHVASAIADGFQQTFNRKVWQGAKNHNLELDLKVQKINAIRNAQEETLRTFDSYLYTKAPSGQVVENIRGRDILDSSGLAIDTSMSGTLRRASQELLSKDEQDRLLSLMNQAMSGGELPANAIDELHDLGRKMQLDELVEQRFDDLMRAADVEPEVKSAIQDVRTAFNKIRESELADGLSVGLISAYIPHKYSNRPNALGTFAGKGAGTRGVFQKTRKYGTLAEALEDGLVGKTDIAQLYSQRLYASYVARAKQSYAHRLILENGIPERHFEKLVGEALEEPGGPAWQALRGFKFDAPRPLAPEQIADLEKITRESRFYGQVLEEAEAARRGAASSHWSKLPDEEAVRAANSALADFEHNANLELYRVGFKPLDSNMAKAAMNEIGTKVKLGKEELFVPNIIAKAMQENLAGGDWLRRSLGSKSPMAAKLLGVVDAANNTFKRWVTFPWPAYWGQNLVGDAFLRFLDGGLNAVNPGLQLRMWDLMNNRSVAMGRGGAVLTGDLFKKALREGGIDMRPSDMLEIFDDVGNLNLDKHLKSKRPILENILTSGNRGVALEQTHERLNNTFNNFFRASQVLHHLERGETVPTAIRAANEALLNYRDLSPVEQSLLRRFYFFYGWLSKSTKNTLTNLVRNPGGLTAQLKAARGFSEFFSDPDAAPTIDQFDSKLLKSNLAGEQISFAIGKDNKGKSLVARGFGLPMNTILEQFSAQMPKNLSLTEVLGAASDSTTRTIQKQFATANPFVKAAAEALSGKNLYFNKSLNSDFLRRIPSFTAFAERFGNLPHDGIPARAFEEVDESIKKFLKGVPDGKGHIIVDPAAFWVATNFIPGLGRLVTTGNLISHKDMKKTSILPRLLSGVRVEESDVERSYLANMRDNLTKLSEKRSVPRIKKNLREGIE